MTPPIRPQVATQLAFRGEAYEDGSLDLEHFEEAVRAMRTLLAEAASVRQEQPPQARLRVEKGSVEFHLSSVLSDPTALLASCDPKELFELVFKVKDLIDLAKNEPVLTISSLLGLAWWLNSKKIVKQEKSDKGMIKITASDGATVLVNSQVVTLGNKPNVRKALQGLTGPLENSRGGRLEITMDGKETFRISADERGRLALSEPESAPQVEEHQRHLTILHAPLAFDASKSKKGMGERFHFLDKQTGINFWAVIQDAPFMAQFRSGEKVLPYGTQMHCIIRETKENPYSESPKITRVILRVMAIHAPAEQRDLFGP